MILQTFYNGQIHFKFVSGIFLIKKCAILTNNLPKFFAPNVYFHHGRCSGNSISMKAPTTVLIQADGNTLEAFGYEAEERYAELADEEKHRPYFYFQRFKMMLFDNKVTYLSNLNNPFVNEIQIVTLFYASTTWFS
jgi:hypothetical protein